MGVQTADLCAGNDCSRVGSSIGGGRSNLPQLLRSEATALVACAACGNGVAIIDAAVVQLVRIGSSHGLDLGSIPSSGNAFALVFADVSRGELQTNNPVRQGSLEAATVKVQRRVSQSVSRAWWVHSFFTYWK